MCARQLCRSTYLPTTMLFPSSSHQSQQPYEQGFLPVMQVYLEKKVGLAPADIDSGEAVFTPEQADQLMGLAKQGLR